jgi:hypothetical protein
MKLPITNTEDYLLIVNDDPIKAGDTFINFGNRNTITKAKQDGNDLAKDYCKKIVAHLPIGEARELDGIPLLPKEVVEDDVEKLAENYALIDNEFEKYKCTQDFKVGYKAATKTFSEEDLRKAILMSRIRIGNKSPKYSIEEIVQSLKQHKPRWFVAEVEYTCCNRYLNCQSCDATAETLNSRIKTTTINGKTYLVGHYE